MVEASLRCLRGDDYDVSQEADDIKVITQLFDWRESPSVGYFDGVFLLCFLQGLHRDQSEANWVQISGFIQPKICSFTYCKKQLNKYAVYVTCHNFLLVFVCYNF